MGSWFDWTGQILGTVSLNTFVKIRFNRVNVVLIFLRFTQRDLQLCRIVRSRTFYQQSDDRDDTQSDIKFCFKMKLCFDSSLGKRFDRRRSSLLMITKVVVPGNSVNP